MAMSWTLKKMNQMQEFSSILVKKVQILSF